MNDREERIIAGLAELKAAQRLTNVHLENINGSIAAHMKDDAEWMQAHDKREATSEGFRRGLFLPLGVVITAASFVGPFVVRIILGG